MKTWIFSLLIAVPVIAGVFWILATALHIYPDPIEVSSETTSSYKGRPQPRRLSAECFALKSETKEVLKQGKSCQVDEDCTTIEYAGCPFGCVIPVNKEQLHRVHAALDKYHQEISKVCGSSCVYRCLKGVYIASCVDNECQTERFPEIEIFVVPDYPFDDEPNKPLNEDTGSTGAG